MSSAEGAQLAMDNRRASLMYRLLKPHTDALALSEEGLRAEIARLPQDSQTRRLQEQRLGIVLDDQAIATALVKDLEWLHPWLKKRNVAFTFGSGGQNAQPAQAEVEAFKRQNEALKGAKPEQINGHTIFLDELNLRWVIVDGLTGLVRLHYSQAAALDIALNHTPGKRDAGWGTLMVPTTSLTAKEKAATP